MKPFPAQRAGVTARRLWNVHAGQALKQPLLSLTPELTSDYAAARGSGHFRGRHRQEVQGSQRGWGSLWGSPVLSLGTCIALALPEGAFPSLPNPQLIACCPPQRGVPEAI